MRTTVAIEDYLLASAKRRAREQDLTLGQLVERALRRELARTPLPAGRPEVPVFTAGAGPRPGVEVISNRAILEALDADRSLEQLR